MGSELENTLAEAIVQMALAEDVGPGDITSEALIPADAQGRASLMAKAPGVLAGLPVAREVFRQVSPAVVFTARMEDGAALAPGARIADMTGPVRALLRGERTALNFLQRLSGIATLTRRCVDAVQGRECRILDTRKTTPGLRVLEKYAVRMGGGCNHRMGLYDQALIKDNHLRALLPEAGDLCGAVALAVRRCRDRAPRGTLVEVEVESLPMLVAALDAGADIIMLDNMPEDAMRTAAERVRQHRAQRGQDRPITEASGGMSPDRLAAVAALGVDCISLGALTHSAPSLDLSMEME